MSEYPWFSQNGSNFQEFLEKEIYLSRAEKPEPVGAALFLREAWAALKKIGRLWLLKNIGKKVSFLVKIQLITLICFASNKK